MFLGDSEGDTHEATYYRGNPLEKSKVLWNERDELSEDERVAVLADFCSQTPWFVYL